MLSQGHRLHFPSQMKAVKSTVITENDCVIYIQFGSWTNHGYALDLQAEDYESGIDISEYTANSEWILLCMWALSNYS